MAPFDCDDPLYLIDRRIASAAHALHGARASCEHSPNSESELVASMCERTMNELLERRYEMTHPVSA